MDVSNIFEQARVLGYTDSSQIGDAQMLVWLNFLYKKVCRRIKAINENYFYGRMYLDTVAYQNQYDFALATASVVAPSKILNIAVKYQADTYAAWTASTVYVIGDKVTDSGYAYVCNVAHTSAGSFDSTKFVRIYEGYNDAREVDYSSNVNNYNDIGVDPFTDRYGILATSFTPVFTLTSSNATGGSSVGNKLVLNLYPAVESVIKDGIQVDYVKTIADLATNTLEADILIERDYHEVLVKGLMPYIFQRKGMKAERIDAMVEYKELEDEIIAAMSDRVQSPTTVQSPDLTNLE